MELHMLDAPLVLTRQFFGCTVFDRFTSRYFPFDVESAGLLCFSAAIPFPAILAAMSPGEKRDRTHRFFTHFYDMGFFLLDGRFAGALLETPPAVDHLTGPLAVHLEISSKCNLTCAHCFAGSMVRGGPPLNLSELDSLFRSMARMGSFRLGLTGGEPLLNRALFDIIDLAHRHGLHPCLTTNGTLITEEIARDFGRRKTVRLDVSLEGADAATNDAVRGAGTFDRVMENIAVLARHAPFALAFTIMKTNLTQVEACARLAERVGASAAVFRPLYPVGSAYHKLDDLMPTYAQHDQALAAVCELEGTDVRSIDPFGARFRQAIQSVIQMNHGCGAANTVCSISLSGDVSPCSFLGAEFQSDTLRERPFEEIWHEGEAFRSMRLLPGGTSETFSGGCRARSLALNGSVNAPDPWIGLPAAVPSSIARGKP